MTLTTTATLNAVTWSGTPRQMGALPPFDRGGRGRMDRVAPARRRRLLIPHVLPRSRHVRAAFGPTCRARFSEFQL